jgi:hypothetical protein
MTPPLTLSIAALEERAGIITPIDPRMGATATASRSWSPAQSSSP